MAEVIGVVASGISIVQLAGQVTACTLKLKAYWDEVKEAPTEIKYLVREIDALSLILSQIQDGYTGGEDVYLQHSPELCRDGAEELKRLVDEMEMKLSLGGGRWKRKIGAAKVVLKKEEMKRLKGRLESAVRMLGSAHQSYIGTMIRMQPEIIVARLSTMNQTVHQTSDEKVVETERSEKSSVVVSKQYACWTSSRTWMQSLIGSIEYRKRLQKRMGRQREEVNLKYQLPDWLAYQAWEVGAYRDRSAWRLSLQTYRVLPSNAPIFQSVQSGDLRRVRHLLATRASYVNDRNEYGRTPLHIAAEHGQTEICQLLLTEGADVMSYDRVNQTPLYVTCSFGGYLYFNRQIDNSPIIRMLIGAGSSELLIQDNDCLKLYRGPEDSFSYLLQQCFPPLNQWSLRDRLSVASSLGGAFWPNSANLIQMVLKPAKLQDIARARLPDDTLLHLCMERYRDDRRGPDDTYKERSETLLERFKNPSDPWRTLTRELIMAGGYVSTLDNTTGMSPLGELMNRNELKFAEIWKAVETWLQDLKDAGVDLEEYGEEEMSLSKSYSVEPSWTDRVGTLMRFVSYGPTVEDWIFYAPEPTDRFAGIFWKLVEKQTRFGMASRAELDFSGMNNPDWSDASSDDSVWLETSEPELELSGMNIPGSWATFDDDEND